MLALLLLAHRLAALRVLAQSGWRRLHRHLPPCPPGPLFHPPSQPLNQQGFAPPRRAVHVAEPRRHPAC
ncbi:MAG: hypothetical protein EBU75_12475 [Betaproteobacteria bacterium]|nr:hypothetical protein [Betaproteobacteria bacterium]